MIDRGSGVFAVLCFGFFLPLLSRPSARPATHKKNEKERHVADGRGGEGAGEEPTPTTARKPGPLSIILCSSVRLGYSRNIPHSVLRCLCLG
jgi:hypothetical protein